MTPRIQLVCFWATLAAAGLGISAQQTPVFRSAAHHVLLDVVATDENDRPVTDLTAADFEILQAGAAQKIADFERVSIPFGDRPIDLKTPPGPPPTIFTNAPPPRTARAFVFMVGSISPHNLIPVRRMLTAFLQALSPDDSVAVVYNGRSNLSQDFTTDPGLIVRAFNNLKASMGGGTGADRPDQWFKTVITSLASARQLRRAVVYVSEGSSLVTIDGKPDLTHLLMLEEFRRAVQLNIPIYTIDPRGLTAPELGLAGSIESQKSDTLRTANRAVFNSKQAMKVIAENTNGLAFTDNWNVPQAARALIGDNNSYYLLGFYPEPYVEDGIFHRVEVRVKRPGIRIRYRQGYQAGSAAQGTEPRLVDSLAVALPGGDLQLQGSATVGTLAKSTPVELRIQISFPKLEQPLIDDRLQFVWIAIDADAKIRASGGKTIAVGEIGGRQTVTEWVSLPRGQFIIRLAVSSKATGLSGTLHVPVQVGR